MGITPEILSGGCLWGVYLLIFVCTGTQIFQFNRLLMELDRLVENGVITEDIFAQTGKSDYEPKYYKYKNFLSPEEYENLVNSSELIITHGGTGAIVKALKAGKQIIAIPRQLKYKEHEDDHQFQIVDFFADNGYILRVIHMFELETKLKEIKEHPIKKKFIGSGQVVQIIDDYIQKNLQKEVWYE